MLMATFAITAIRLPDGAGFQSARHATRAFPQ